MCRSNPIFFTTPVEDSTNKMIFKKQHYGAILSIPGPCST